MFHEWPFLDRLDAAADAGFALVECQFPYEARADAIASRLARTGLAMTMFNTPPGNLAAGELGFAALPDRFETLAASVETALAYAAALDVEALHLLAGRTGDDASARQAFRRNLAWAAERLDRQGITLLIEPVNARDNPGYFLTDLGAAEKAIRELALTNVRLQYDTYHRRTDGGAIAEEIQGLLPIVGHVQVSSPPDRGEPDEETVAFLRLLDSLGYGGVVGCEYIPRTATLDTLGWRERL